MLDPTYRTRISATDALAHPFVMKTYMAGADADTCDIMGMEEVLFKMRNFAELPLLKRASLTVLAHMVGSSGSNLEKQRLTFRRLDTDGGGSIDKQEFMDGMKRESADL